MDKEEVEEELAALRRGLEEMNGLYEALQEIGSAIISTHPDPLAVGAQLHYALEQWDAKRMPLPSRAAQLLASMRTAADQAAALKDPEGLAQQRQHRERDQNAS